uniref:Uncharacterized protein n=1 Tax=Acidicaldus sp. TaxID=1872105 RepID=A0A8J4H8W9_9PROT
MSAPALPDSAPEGPSPLEILLAVMRAKWAEGDADGAALLARAAAPYLHPRRAPQASPSARAKPAPQHLSDAELLREIQRLAPGSDGFAPGGDAQEKNPDLLDGLGASRAGSGGPAPGGASPGADR